MEELKNALLTVADFTVAVDTALEDNKISPTEGIGLGIKFIGFWKIVKNFPLIKEQFTNLTAEQRAEINAAFQEKFDLRDDQLEGIVEMVIAALLQLNDVISAFKPEV